jgi:lipopolysaccharide biosynthesis regulator YciM
MSDTQQIQLYEQMLVEARRARNQFSIAEAQGALGNLYAARGEIHRGIECLEESLRIRMDVLRDYDKAATTCKEYGWLLRIGVG